VLDKASKEIRKDGDDKVEEDLKDWNHYKEEDNLER
jgi:hypothetical protein